MDKLKINKLETIINSISSKVLRLLGFFVPKNKDIWIFGERSGTQFTGNSKYLFLHIIENYKNIHPIWFTKEKGVFEKIKKLNGEVYFINSIKALYYGLIGKVYIHSFGRGDIVNYSKKNALFINLYHGTAPKKMRYRYQKDDLDTATSEFTREMVRKKMFPNIKKFAITGDPRDAILLKEINKLEILKKYQLEKFANKKIISYLPTFRLFRKDYKPIFSNFEKINQLENIVIFEKSHPHEQNSAQKIKTQTQNIINISNLNFDTQELLAITDIFITDYSSCYIDFLLTERPMIFYPYDLEEFSKYRSLLFNYEKIIPNGKAKNEIEMIDEIKYYLENNKLDEKEIEKYSKEGFFFDYNEFTPGIKVYTEDEIFEAIKRYLENPDLDKEKRMKLKNTFHKYQDSKSAERVYQEIIKLLEVGK